MDSKREQIGIQERLHDQHLQEYTLNMSTEQLPHQAATIDGVITTDIIMEVMENTDTPTTATLSSHDDEASSETTSEHSSNSEVFKHLQEFDDLSAQWGREENPRINGALSPFAEYHDEPFQEWDEIPPPPPTEHTKPKTQYFHGEWQCGGAFKPWMVDSKELSQTFCSFPDNMKLPGSYEKNGRSYNFKTQYYVCPRYWPINVGHISEESMFWMKNMCRKYAQWDVTQEDKKVLFFKTNHPMIFVFVFQNYINDIHIYHKGFVIFDGQNHCKSPKIVFKTPHALYDPNMIEKLCSDTMWNPETGFETYLLNLYNRVQNKCQFSKQEDDPNKIKNAVYKRNAIIMRQGIRRYLSVSLEKIRASEEKVNAYKKDIERQERKKRTCSKTEEIPAKKPSLGEIIASAIDNSSLENNADFMKLDEPQEILSKETEPQVQHDYQVQMNNNGTNAYYYANNEQMYQQSSQNPLPGYYQHEWQHVPYEQQNLLPANPYNQQVHSFSSPAQNRWGQWLQQYRHPMLIHPDQRPVESQQYLPSSTESQPNTNCTLHYTGQQTVKSQNNWSGTSPFCPSHHGYYSQPQEQISCQPHFDHMSELQPQQLQPRQHVNHHHYHHHHHYHQQKHSHYSKQQVADIVLALEDAPDLPN